jgi:hypothetical protein
VKTQKIRIRLEKPKNIRVEFEVPKADFCWDGYTHCKFCGKDDKKKRKWVMCKYFDNNHKNQTCVPYCDLFEQYLTYNRKKETDMWGEVPKPENCRRINKLR